MPDQKPIKHGNCSVWIFPPPNRGIVPNQTNTVKDYTCERPPPAPGGVAVRGGAGCEFGPGGEGAVILAGNEALLDEGWHGSCPAHAVTDGSRATLLRQARHSCKQRDRNLYLMSINIASHSGQSVLVFCVRVTSLD